MITDKVDIAHARLQFASGAVANLTASRVSTERVRKLPLFPGDTKYLPGLRAPGCAARSRSPARSQPEFDFEPIPTRQEEPLAAELRAFADAVRHRTAPLIDGPAGLRALELADRVMSGILEHNQRVQLDAFLPPREN